MTGCFRHCGGHDAHGSPNAESCAPAEQQVDLCH
nr:MAG TPA: hypothetical protein [Caudoviricetes sp.]